MSLELRVQHLEELVVELRRQVAALQARLGPASPRSSSFELVNTASSEGLRGASSAEREQLQTSSRSGNHSEPLTAWNPRPLTSTAPAPSPPRPHITAAERAAACREIGLFLRRCLEGEHRGASGRDRLRGLQSRYWLVVRDFAGFTHRPVTVCSSFADCARLCKQGGDCGESIFIGLPARQDIIAVCSAASFNLPSSW